MLTLCEVEVYVDSKYLYNPLAMDRVISGLNETMQIMYPEPT